MATEATVREIISQYAFPGVQMECVPFGSGHINDTFRLAFQEEGVRKRYVLQKINTEIFTRPEELMENVSAVTSWLRKKIEEAGGDPERETLNVIPTSDGRLLCKDAEGDYWRVYLFIEGATCFDRVLKDDDFYQSALAFGHFQRQLADFPAHTLHETIHKFHDMPDRYRKFQEALAADAFGRAASVQEEIRFIREREKLVPLLADLLKSGQLPLRVTHNDTKLNNVMIDNATGRAICVIDLDTVMPGLSVNDFGDSIRFGASTAAEDEQDLSKVSCDLHLYEIYVKGFVEGCAGALTDLELEMLPEGALMMTFEHVLRFLTDHLEGDHYYKIHRSGQNLDRARAQMKLVQDMEAKMDQMKAIVRAYK